MESPKISTHKKGFSLIEVCVVLGMLAIAGSLALVVSMATYEGGSFNNEQNLLVSALQKARSQSMSAVCAGSACTAGVAHGVDIEPTQLVIFQGSSYNPGDEYNEYIPLPDAGVTFSGAHTIVFAELSGDASTPGDIGMSDITGRVATVSVGSDGQLVW
jgi:prepilin-type N-terminal cleavage/methylation domain-containing protein